MKNVATNPDFSTANLGGTMVAGSGVGGDLSGSLPAPTVTGIGGVPIATVLGEFVTKDFGGQDFYHDNGSLGTTATIDLSTGNYQYGTLTANCTFTFTGTGTGVSSFTLELTEDGTGGWSPTWPGSVVWAGGSAPTWVTTAGSRSYVVFWSRDGGTTWVGSAVGSGGTLTGITIEDEGTPLSTLATGLNYVGAGVTATGSGTTKTITIPGGTTLPWFDVRDYGAVLNGTTDDTAAVQAAINACMTAGGGTVYFPPTGICQISGVMTSTGTYNSQLQIPNVAFGGVPKAIRFLGWAPNTTYGGSPATPGSVIRTDWNTTISGHPAMLAAGSYRPGSPESNVMVVFEDLVLTAPDDPHLTMLQMTAASNVRVRNVQIRTTTSAPGSLPTHSNAVGLEGPWGYASTVPDEVRNLDVYGFYTGMVPAEQTTGGNIGFAYCAQAINFVGDRTTALTFWPNYFSQVVITGCPRGLVFTGDLRWVHIGILGLQNNGGTFDSVYHIDDANNYARGFIAYHVVQVGSPPTLPDLLMNGGTGLSLFWDHGKYWKLNSVVEIPTGTDPSTNPATGYKQYAASSNNHPTVRLADGTTHDLLAGGASAGTPALTLGTTNAAGSAGTFVATDATVATFDATVPTTQAFGDVAATGSAAKAARRDHLHGMPAAPAGAAHYLVISSSHSTPLVFDDIVQSSAGDDFVYTT